MVDPEGRERAAWIRSVVERHERTLVVYAARITGDAESARDVVQEAYLRLCRTPRGDVEDGVLPWLLRVCRNVALDGVRKESRTMSAEPQAMERVADPGAPPPALAGGAEAASEIVSALGALPANQQEVLRLKFQQGLSYRDISAVTGHSVSNVGFLIHSGIKTLRARMGGGRREGVRS